MDHLLWSDQSILIFLFHLDGHLWEMIQFKLSISIKFMMFMVGMMYFLIAMPFGGLGLPIEGIK